MGKETDEEFLSEVLNMVNDRACVAQVADRFSWSTPHSTALATSSSRKP